MSQKHLWIAFGDIHEKYAPFDSIPELAEADGIIVTGDLTNYGGAVKAASIMQVLRTRCPRVLAQAGNLDKPSVDDWLTDQSCNIHAKITGLAPGIFVLGLGGSTPTPGHTPLEFTEEQYRSWLSPLTENARRCGHLILASHNPPKDTACDRLTNGMHVGSEAVRSFIGDVQPELCICGHIHESMAEDSIGKTKIINPGMLGEGGYVVIRFGQDGLSAELKQIR